jgi:hypothetical protein
MSTNTLADPETSAPEFQSANEETWLAYRFAELVNRTPGPNVRAYHQVWLYAKSGSRNWGVECEVIKHIMDTRHQCVCVLLQMSGVYITIQRFVKGIGQGEIPPEPGFRSHIGKRKMQPDEFIR